MDENGDGARILVVDDDPDFLEFATTVLEGAGYEVGLAPNENEADWEAREGAFDLILLDVMMDKLDSGFQFLWKMKRDDRMKSVPVIMVTAVDREMKMNFGCHARKGAQTDEERAYLPVADYIVKPVAAEELLARVKTALIECAREASRHD